MFGGRIDPNLGSRNNLEQVSTYVRSLFMYITCPLYNHDQKREFIESDHCREQTHKPPRLAVNGYYVAPVFIHSHYNDKKTFIYFMLLGRAARVFKEG